MADKRSLHPLDLFAIANYPEAKGLHVLNTEEIYLKNGVTMNMVYITLFHGMGVNSEYAVITRVCKKTT